MSEKGSKLYDCTTKQGLSDPSLVTQIIVLYAINILPTLLTIIGNATCIYAIVKTRSLQTISNVWVGILCISDAIVGILAQPIFYASLISMITGKGIYDFWLVSTNISMFTGCVSFMLAYFVTLDRYIAICHPFWYARVVTKSWCIFGAVLAFLLSVPPIIVNNLMPSMIQLYLTMQMVLIVSQITAFYFRIYVNILRQRRHISSLAVAPQDRAKLRRGSIEKRRAYTIGIIIALMLISYTPMNIIMILFGKTTAYDICTLSEKAIVAIAWGQFFVLLNSAMNPIIYCLRMREIRKAIKRLFPGKDLVSGDHLTIGIESQGTSMR